MASCGKKPVAKMEPRADEDRRKFLATCGKFAVVTPPALTVLLSTSLNSTAVAQSSGRRGDDDDRDWGFRHHRRRRFRHRTR